MASSSSWMGFLLLFGFLRPTCASGPAAAAGASPVGQPPRAADPAGGPVSPLWGLGLPEVFCLLSAGELLSPPSPELYTLKCIHAGGCIGVTPVAG